MEKVTVKINIASLDVSCDFVIPDNLAVRDIISLASRIISFQYGNTEDSSAIMLYDLESGRVLHGDLNLKQQGVSDSTKLVLM